MRTLKRLSNQIKASEWSANRLLWELSLCVSATSSSASLSQALKKLWQDVAYCYHHLHLLGCPCRYNISVALYLLRLLRGLTNTPGPRQFGPETLRHWCQSVRTLRHQKNSASRQLGVNGETVRTIGPDTLVLGPSGGSRIFARGVRQLVPLECPKPLHALSPSDP